MRRRLGPVVGTVLAVTVVMLLGSAVLAQSPDPSLLPSPARTTPTTPTTAPVPDPCARLAELPAVLDGRPLAVSGSDGVTALDPDDLIDPLLAGLGRAREDVCVAIIRTGGGGDALTGQLLRIVGADPTDLAERLAATLHDRLLGMGAQASASPTDLDGITVWTLAIVAAGQTTRIVIGNVGDTVLITSDPVAMRLLAPLLRVAPSPVPSPSAATIDPAG